MAIEAWGLEVLRARRSGNLTFFIFTLILAEFVIYILTLLFGTEPQTLFPSILSPVHIVGGIAVSDWDLRAVGVYGRRAGGAAAFLRFGKEGQFLIAVADNAELAELYGISARRPLRHCGDRRRADRRWRCFCSARAADHAELGAGADPDRGDRHASGRHRAVCSGAASRRCVLALITSYSVLVIGSRWQSLLTLRLPVRHHRVVPERHPSAAPAHPAPVSATPVRTAPPEG